MIVEKIHAFVSPFRRTGAVSNEISTAGNNCVSTLPLFAFRAPVAPSLQRCSYLRSEECRVEEDLLTAFKDCRPDLLRQAQNDRTLRRLETAIVRIAKALTVPGDEEDDYDAGAPVRCFARAGSVYYIVGPPPPAPPPRVLRAGP